MDITNSFLRPPQQGGDPSVQTYTVMLSPSGAHPAAYLPWTTTVLGTTLAGTQSNPFLSLRMQFRFPSTTLDPLPYASPCSSVGVKMCFFYHITL